MSKHRKPSRLARASRIANSPMQLTIAAGVAGTVAVTGTVVASAAPTTKPEARKDKSRPVAEQLVVTTPSEVGTQDTMGVRSEIATAQLERADRLAAARARAIEKRKDAKQAAEKRARKRAVEARTFSAASRGVERMSASAANVLQLAAATASGAYYSHGGAGSKGFDCSGFTSYVFRQMGIELPHSSSAQRSVAQPVSNPQPGDLVFVYNGGGGSIGHVGIYAGGGQWWEASNPSSGVGRHGAWSSAVSYGRVL
ncbi:MAG: C40 family peptidase [Spirochaetaceae bacterium]|nr:C40 family peptidase [Spirochaetaceae bacterium]